MALNPSGQGMRGCDDDQLCLQMKQSMAAAEHAQQHSMDKAAQQQHQHHQSMAAAYDQGTASRAPFQAVQDQRVPASQSLRPSNSQRNMSSGGLAAGAVA